MDSLFWVLRFQIGNSELKKLLEDAGFVPTSEVENLWLWNRRIWGKAQIHVNITEDWQAYVLEEKRAKKYIFFSTNSSDVVFALDNH